MVAAVRPGHPLTEGPLTPARLAAAEHVVVSRRGRFTGPLDTALAEQDLHRRVSVVLPGHLAAMTLAARSDIVCLVPAAPPGAAPSPLTYDAARPRTAPPRHPPGTATADHRHGLAPPPHSRRSPPLAPQRRPPDSLHTNSTF